MVPTSNISNSDLKLLIVEALAMTDGRLFQSLIIRLLKK